MATGQLVFCYTIPGEGSTRLEAGWAPYYLFNGQFVQVDQNNLDWSISRGLVPYVYNSGMQGHLLGTKELPRGTVFSAIPRVHIAGYYDGPNFIALNPGEEARYICNNLTYVVATMEDIEFVRIYNCVVFIVNASGLSWQLKAGTMFTTQFPSVQSNPAPHFSPSQYGSPQYNTTYQRPQTQYNPPNPANPAYQYAQYNPPNPAYQYAQYNPPSPTNPAYQYAQCNPPPPSPTNPANQYVQYNPPPPNPTQFNPANSHAQYNPPPADPAPYCATPSYTCAAPNIPNSPRTTAPPPDSSSNSSEEVSPQSTVNLSAATVQQPSITRPTNPKRCSICQKDKADYYTVFGAVACLDCLAKKINNQELSTGNSSWSEGMIKDIYDMLHQRRPDSKLIPIPNPPGMVVCCGKDVPTGYPPRGHFVGVDAIVNEDGCSQGHVLCKGCANKLTNCPICNEFIYYEDLPGGCPSGEVGGCATFVKPCLNCNKTWPRKKRVPGAPEAPAEAPAEVPAEAPKEAKADEPEKVPAKEPKVEDAKVEESKDQGPKLEEPKRNEVSA